MVVNVVTKAHGVAGRAELKADIFQPLLPRLAQTSPSDHRLDTATQTNATPTKTRQQVKKRPLCVFSARV